MIGKTSDAQPLQSSSGARIGSALVLTSLLWFVPLPAGAQTPSPGGIAPPSRPERPYRGLFGGGVGDTAQSLTFDGSLGGGTGDSSHSTVAPGPGQSLGHQDSGSFTGSGNFSYSMSRGKFVVHASNTILADYYRHPSASRFVPRDIATAAVSFSPSATTGVGVGFTYKNVPEFTASDFFDGEAAEILPLNQNLGLTYERYSRYGTTLDVSQKLGRVGMAAGVSYAHGMLPSKAWTILVYSGTVSYNISKGIGVYLEYKDGGQRDETPGRPRVTDRHPRTSFGIEYSKPLSLSRRTTLSFTTGTAGMHDRALDETKYQLVGSVSLNREIGRTWLASLTYSRDVRHIESLGEPLLADYFVASLRGSLSHRLQFGARFGGSSGQLGTSSQSATTSEMYFGGVQLSVALTRMLGLTSDYAYYSYRLPAHELLSAPAGPGQYQVVKAYLQIWFPLLTHTKR